MKIGIGTKVEVDIENIEGTDDLEFLETLGGVKMEVVEITNEYKDETIPTFKCINIETKEIILGNKKDYFPFVEADLKIS
jgi:hypothetical protein